MISKTDSTLLIYLTENIRVKAYTNGAGNRNACYLRNTGFGCEIVQLRNNLLRSSLMTKAGRSITSGIAGALVLPERVGLGKPPHSGRRGNQFMTVAWYLAAGVAAAAVATALADASSGNTAD